jgi:4-amino-4-deoxy-L-arabinose transferase-like glycosyltransferase
MLVFTFALTPEFIGFQARFAMFTQEMLRHGPSFFPTAYDRPYPDYPATSTFMAYLVSRLLGQVTPLAAVLPTAVASALVLVVTYRIGAMRSRQWGLAAVLFALLTVEFFSASREITLDQYTSLAAALSFYLVYSADCLGSRKRLWLLLPTWIFGFAFRGPVGLALPAAVVCGHYLWHRRWRLLVLAVMSAGITLGLCLIGLLAAAEMEGGDALAGAVLVAQMTGRMHGRGEAATYYWCRCFTSYALAYPLAIVLLACRARDIFHRSSEDDSLLGSLAVWTLVVLAAMSILAANKMRYVLPIVPAISLMASYPMVAIGPKGMLFGIKRWFLGFCLFLPACAGVAVLAIFLFAWRVQPSWQAHYFSTFATLVLLAALSARLRRKWTDHPKSALTAMAIAVAAFVTLHIGIVDPIHYGLERTRPFVSQVEALYEKDPRTLVFFRVGPDAEGIRFMVNLSKPLAPQFLGSFDELRELPGPAYVLMKEQTFLSMPADDAGQMRSLGRGKIGHKDFLILSLDKPQGVQAG